MGLVWVLGDCVNAWLAFLWWTPAFIRYPVILVSLIAIIAIAISIPIMLVFRWCEFSAQVRRHWVSGPLVFVAVSLFFGIYQLVNGNFTFEILLMVVAAPLVSTMYWVSRAWAAVHREAITLCVASLVSSRMTDKSGISPRRVAVLTGANRGIGFHIACGLAMSGMTVVIACRSVENGEKAARRIRAHCCKVWISHDYGSACREDDVGVDPKLDHSNDSSNRQCADVSVVQLDTSSLKSVRQCADTLLQMFGPQGDKRGVHVLVNNAGGFPDHKLSVDGYENSFASCHLGHFALTQWISPLLILSNHSRVITTSSGAGNVYKTCMDGTGSLTGTLTSSKLNDVQVYMRSKLCNILHMRQLQRRVDKRVGEWSSLISNSSVKCFSFHPGCVLTEIWDKLPLPASILKGFYFLASFIFRSSQYGADTALFLALSPIIMSDKSYAGAFCVDNAPAEEQCSDLSKDENEENGILLWDTCEEILKKHSPPTENKQGKLNVKFHSSDEDVSPWVIPTNSDAKYDRPRGYTKVTDGNSLMAAIEKELAEVDDSEMRANVNVSNGVVDNDEGWDREMSGSEVGRERGMTKDVLTDLHSARQRVGLKPIGGIND